MSRESEKKVAPNRFLLSTAQLASVKVILTSDFSLNTGVLQENQQNDVLGDCACSPPFRPHCVKARSENAQDEYDNIDDHPNNAPIPGQNA